MNELIIFLGVAIFALTFAGAWRVCEWLDTRDRHDAVVRRVGA